MAYPGASRPKNVGILGIEVYFPQRYVSQDELEDFDGVSKGKYTIGLGQERMAFTDDREDINSFLLNAVSGLLKKYNINPKDVGHLEVGTETIIDKAKATKTVLMDLFSDNKDIEGVDTKNACYGGTAAVLNAINWVESSSWDGRYAIVAAGDIAIYAEGGARPVGGAGAAAILIGPDAPLVFDPIHGSYVSNVWDFYKPDLSSEYPTVDGPLTTTAYPGALQQSYLTLRSKLEKYNHEDLTVDSFDYFAFHSPYGKLVQKAYARLVYLDFVNHPNNEKFAHLDKSLTEKVNDLSDKNVEKTFVAETKDQFATKVKPSMLTANRLGNMYSGSVWGALASLIDTVADDQLRNKRVGLFSYGSGLAASFLSLRVVGSVQPMKDALQLKSRLDAATKVSPQQFVDALNLREEYHLAKNKAPSGSIDNIVTGGYYLDNIDDMFRRSYKIKN